MSDASSAAIAAHYRALALDAYAAGDPITDETEKRIMQQIALGYEHLASNAEERARLAFLAGSVPKPETA